MFPAKSAVDTAGLKSPAMDFTVAMNAKERESMRWEISVNYVTDWVS